MIMIVNILAVFVFLLMLERLMLSFILNQSIFQTLSPISVLIVKRFVIQGKHFKFIKVNITNMIKSLQ